MGEHPAGAMNDRRVPLARQIAIPHRGPHRRLVVPVDVDNDSPALAPRILAEAMKHGGVEIRRAFGAVAASRWTMVASASPFFGCLKRYGSWRQNPAVTGVSPAAHGHHGIVDLVETNRRQPVERRGTVVHRMHVPEWLRWKNR